MVEAQYLPIPFTLVTDLTFKFRWLEKWRCVEGQRSYVAAAVDIHEAVGGAGGARTP